MKRWERILLYANTFMSACVLAGVGFLFHGFGIERESPVSNAAIAPEVKSDPRVGVSGFGDAELNERTSPSVSEPASNSRRDRSRERALEEYISQRKKELKARDEVIEPRAKHTVLGNQWELFAPALRREPPAARAALPAPSPVPTSPGPPAGTPGVTPPEPSQ
jgi:hypothetical protein